MAAIIRKLIRRNLFNLFITGLVIGLYFMSSVLQIPMLVQLFGIAILFLTFLRVR